MIRWLHRRRDLGRLVTADADNLIRRHGAGAYWQARNREGDGIQIDAATHQMRTPAHWRRVALLVARRTRPSSAIDRAMRKLMLRHAGAH